MAARIRAFDWSATALGPIADWPQSLKTIVDLMLASPSMMSLVWGPDAIHIYNDGFTELLREHRTEALGRSAYETFARSREVFDLDLAAGMAGRSARLLAQRYLVLRNDRLEDAWFDVDYAPVRDEQGKVAGVLWTLKETTKQVLGERILRESQERQAFLLKLSDALRPLSDAAQIQSTTTRLLGTHLGVDRAMYAEVEGEPGAETGIIRGQYVRPAADGHPPVAPFPERFTFAAFGPNAMEARRRGEPLVVADINAAAGFAEPERAAWVSTGVRAAVVAPLAKDGRLRADIGVHSATPRDWTAADVALIQEVGERTWAAVERARAEAALRESEERFRTMADNAPVLIWETDRNGLTSANQHYADFYGTQIGELVGMGWANALHPDDARQYLDAYLDAFERRTTYTCECRLLRADGQYRWLRSSGGPLGESRFIGCSLDVTDLLDAREAIRENEERLRGVLDGMAEGFGVLAPDFTILEYNREALRMDGRPKTAILGQSHWDAFPGTEHSEVGRVLKRAMTDRQPAFLEHLYAWEEGRARWLDLRVYPIASGGLSVFWRDVTERKEAEASLRESEERYRELFVSMDEAYAVVEVLKDDAGRWSDFRFVEVNPAFMVHTTMPYPVGRTATELLGAPNPRWTELYGQALDSGKKLRVEETEATLGITFDLNIFALDRARNRVAVLFTNITDRKEAELALRDSEERQRLMVELVPALLWSASPDGREITLNEQWLAYTAQDEAQTQDFGWLDAIHPEDVPGTQAAFGQAFATGEPLERKHRVRKAGDGWRWHLIRQLPVRDGNGAITRWFGAAVDIHDSKLAELALAETERRLQTLVEGVPQLVWRAVDGGRWTWASPQWTDYTGQAETDSHDRGWLHPVHPDDRDRVLAVWDGAIERGEFHADYRICHVREQRYRWFQTRATPVRDGRGAIIEWLGTSTDVDDLRSLQDRQQVLVAELQHRTRNLLGVVRSMADKTARASADLPDFRARFRERLEALSRVQGLLSRLDQHDRVTFDELIRTELAAMGGGSGRATLEGPPGVRLRSSTVQTLAMALHELATNAVKYGALGQPSGRLAIRWSLEDRDGKPWLHIDWRESGVTMPPLGSAPAGTGQGRELIERALPYQLSAKTSYSLGPEGVHCTISVPVSASKMEANHG